MTRITANPPALIALASIAILGTALASQYLGGLAPCELCHYQRWPYVFTIVVGLTAWLAPVEVAWRPWMVGACAAAFGIGGAIAIYHAGVEYGFFAGPTACSGIGGTPDTIEALRQQLLAQPVVRCDEPAWTMMGISMAGYNAIVSTMLAAASVRAAVDMTREEPREEPREEQ
jgi:disulfide bond formation protein DsbB